MAGRNEGDSEAIYGNQDTIVFQNLITTGNLIGDENDMDENYDGFSRDEKETEEYSDDFTSDEETEEYLEQMQPTQEDNIQGEGCVDNIYETPFPRRPTINDSSTSNKFPGLSQPSGQLTFPLNNSSSLQHHGGVTLSHHSSSKEMPSARHNMDSDTQNNERSPNLPVVDQSSGRGPAPLPEQFTASRCKASVKLPDLSRFQCPSPSNGISHFPRNNITQDDPTKNGGSKVKGGSFLFRQLSAKAYQIKEHAFSNQPMTKSSQHCISPLSQEENDVYDTLDISERSFGEENHVYDTLDISERSFGIPSSKTPGPNASDQKSPVRPRIPPPKEQIKDQKSPVRPRIPPPKEQIKGKKPWYSLRERTSRPENSMGVSERQEFNCGRDSDIEIATMLRHPPSPLPNHHSPLTSSFSNPCNQLSKM